MHFQYDARCLRNGAAVHGTVGMLLSGARQLCGSDTASALEVAAGGRLFNVRCFQT